MSSFKPKPVRLARPAVSEQLRLAREEKGLRIEKLARRLSIKPEYLRALENGQYFKLPQGLYSKSFLKKYAEHLNLDSKIILEDFSQEQASYNPNYQSSKKDNVFATKVVAKNKLLIFPRIIRNVIIAVVVLICLLYLQFYLRKIFTPPQLEIYSPTTDMIISENKITVSGQTEAEAEISINGNLILSDEEGNFSQELNLKQGLNNIVIKTKKKYSRERIITRQLLVE